MARKSSLGGASLAELYSEIGKRRAGMRTTHGARAVSCECGECPKCKKRIQMREYRAGKK